MLPQTQKRKTRNSSKVNLLISLVFHSALAVVVIYFAAREGLLGKQIKKIAVEMIKEKKEPEKHKEPEKPKEQIATPTPPKTVAIAEPPRQVVSTPPPANVPAAPPAVAPPSVDLPSFSFEGGRAVETSSDPVKVYKGLLEYSIHSKWNRPEDIDDSNFVAEVEVSVDSSGQISGPVWKRNSGNQRWDASVREALANTKSLTRSPPTNFPSHVLVRFDTTETDALQLQP